MTILSVLFILWEKKQGIGVLVSFPVYFPGLLIVVDNVSVWKLEFNTLKSNSPKPAD